MASNCTSDDAFGPFVADTCRSGFDFTLLFEQSILSLLPAAVFILAASARLASLARRAARTKGNVVRVAKLAVAAILAALQLAAVVVWSRAPWARTRLSIPAVAVNFAAALLLTAASWLEDARSVRPSTLLNVYLLFSLLFDVAQVRTLWLLFRSYAGSSAVLPALLSASVTVKTALLLLEAREKRRYLLAPYARLPPEPTSGIVNRSFLWWVNDLFRRGLRTLLAHDDLYELDDDLAASGLADRVQRAWDARRRPERRLEFAWAIYRALWRPFLAAVLPRVFLIGFTFAQPFLIRRVLQLISSPASERTDDAAYGLIGATAVIYLGIAVTRLHYNHNTFRFLTMFRGAVVSLIYRRSLLVQDGLYDESAAVTLMSTDVDRIVSALERVNETWSRLIEVAIGMALLALQIGWVSVMPILVVLISFFGSTMVSKTIGGRQKIWVEAVQKRIAITSSMLAEMRSVKMLGLSRLLTTIVQNLRVEETHRMAGYRWNIVWLNVVANLPAELGPAITFVVFAIQARVRGTDSLDTTLAFTSLSIITLLSDPAADLLSAIPFTAASLGCFDRIQKFLLAPAREDLRLVFGSRGSVGMRTDNAVSSAVSTSADIELASIKNSSARGGGTSPDTPAVWVDDVEARPVSEADVVLRGVSFRLERGSVTMLLGPVGSGKSTLLKVVLGEVACDKGQVTVSTRRIAFCSQSAWLPNTTIRQAICGPRHAGNIDEEWYKKTLRACALDVDLGLMDKGDETPIGAGSTELSGGQKHRVALARAVYDRAEIVLLDDVLSALDAKTARIVVERLLGADGLFRTLGSTVLLVTHSTKYLSYADKLLVLAEGHIEHEGPPEQILQNPVLVDEIAHDQDEDEDEDDQESSVSKPADVAAQERAAEIEKANRRRDLTRASGDVAVYKYYLRAAGWRMPSVFFILCLSQTFCSFFGPVLLSFWTADHGGKMALYTTFYVVLALANVFSNGGYIWASIVRISPHIARKLHYVVLRTVMRAPASYLSQTDSGQILNRFSQDMTIIEGELNIAVLITLSNFLHSVAGAALIATGSSYMAASIPLLMAVIFGLQYVYLRTSRQLRLLDLENRSPLYSHFLESLSGLSIIRAFGWEKENVEKNVRLLDFSQRPYYLLFCVQRWLNLVLDLIVAAEAVLVVGLALGLRGSTTAGLLGVSLNNILFFNSSLSSLVGGYTQLETSLGSMARVKDFEAEVKPEDREGEDMQPPSGWPDKGAIQLDSVTASHNPSAVAIKDVTLSINPGTKVGICGRTGSGKSSLVATLLRLLEIEQGTITIDGLDLTRIPRDTVRERLITIPQDPLVLVGSVRLNADPHGAHADADVVAALERVGLWAGVLQERGGLEAEMTQSSLSRGQQQLFALARAVLDKRSGRCGRVLLLDEATSSVDAETGETMQRVLEEEFAEHTVLAVAHRIHTVLACDVVVVMDEGRVVEVGPPSELVKKEDGRFASLARL